MKDRKGTSKFRVVRRDAQAELRGCLAGHGQALLPMLELVENAQASIDELMGDAARTLIEQLLVSSAQQVAGAKHQGRAGGQIGWHGMERGRIDLAERGLSVQRPRLRTKGRYAREVAIPAYERLRGSAAHRGRVREILLAGVSTRRYHDVLPQAAASVGVAKSSVSRKFIQASAEQLRALAERRFDGVELLAIYIDGIVIQRHHVIAAIGVDQAGAKHLLGLCGGATENAQVVKDLLRSLIARGVPPERKYLFVIDGAKALRSAIEELFGAEAPVQRCRTHKVRNVLERLPKQTAAQVKAVMRAAYQLEAKDGMAKLRQQAKWNLIENPNGAVRRTARRVTHYQDAEMAMRWAASGYLEAEKRFRKIHDHRELWVLSQALGRESKSARVDQHARAA